MGFPAKYRHPTAAEPTWNLQRIDWKEVKRKPEEKRTELGLHISTARTSDGPRMGLAGGSQEPPRPKQQPSSRNGATGRETTSSWPNPPLLHLFPSDVPPDRFCPSIHSFNNTATHRTHTVTRPSNSHPSTQIPPRPIPLQVRSSLSRAGHPSPILSQQRQICASCLIACRSGLVSRPACCLCHS